MANVNSSDVMKAYAQDAEADARKRGFILDYTEDSLDTVDRILGDITAENLISPQTEAEKDALWAFSKMYGGYVGEVVIREMSGQWELQEHPEGGVHVVLRCRGSQAVPLEKISKRLTQDRYSVVNGYCRAIRAILDRNKMEGGG